MPIGFFFSLSTSCARLRRAGMWLQLFRGYAAGRLLRGAVLLVVVVAEVATIAILAWVGAWDGFLGGGLDFSELLIRFVD